MSEQKVKIVVVGDQNVEKSTLMLKYTEWEAEGSHSSQEDLDDKKYSKTIFDSKMKSISYQSRSVHLSLWDSSGQQPYHRIRRLAYAGTDVFLIAFSLNDKSSFVNAKQKWLIEVQQQTPNAKIIFVGIKSTKSNSDSQNLLQVPQKELEEHIMNKTQCQYRQIDLSVHNDKIDQLFQTAASLALCQPPLEFNSVGDRECTCCQIM